MKKNMAYVLALFLLLPGCRRKAKRLGKNSDKYGTSQAGYEGKKNGAGTFEEEIEEFVLNDKNELNPFATGATQSHNSGEDFEDEVEDEAPLNQQHDGKLKTVYYGFNHYGVSPDQKLIVQKNAEQIKLALKKDKNAHFAVEGHACHSAGSKKYNQSLSDRRAGEYKNQLVKNGVPKSSLKTFGRGSEMPIVLAGNSEEQAPNRRVEVYPISQHKTV